MQQYMAQFTGEEPAQIREHSRVAELERKVARLQDVLDKFEAIVHKQDARVEQLKMRWNGMQTSGITSQMLSLTWAILPAKL